MSLLGKYARGWRVRSPTPSFEPGSEYRVVLTGYEAGEGAAVARVGDSKLYVADTDRSHVDAIGRVRVTEFDEDTHVGRAELLEVVGETTY